MVEQDLSLAVRGEHGAVSYPDSIGVGMYRIDLHPSTGGDNYIDVGSCPFEIPLGALIPQRMENLLPAGKNIGTTHITNGRYRHPGSSGTSVRSPACWPTSALRGASPRARSAAPPPAGRIHGPHLGRRRGMPLAADRGLLNPGGEESEIRKTVRPGRGDHDRCARLTACGGGGDAKDDGPASLRMTVWSANEAHLKLFNEIADEYRKNNPDVAEIKFDPLPFENYTTTLTTQIAGGNAPDLAWIFETRRRTSSPPAR
ncbi:FAD-dependent oxidoreductase [Micromonospora sp. BRA006-A]|nr:FAD-dependent oxidoreductase [Micromonospora sp. BRA006-A]